MGIGIKDIKKFIIKKPIISSIILILFGISLVYLPSSSIGDTISIFSMGIGFIMILVILAHRVRVKGWYMPRGFYQD